LRDTPARVVRSWEELYAGYAVDPSSLFTVFEDGACREMVALTGAAFFSTCEHHLLPFYGEADIAYIPDGKVIGVSKLVRILDCFARRLQIQERLTAQIADCLVEHLSPKGVMVVVRAQHLCMLARGVKREGAKMVTSAVRGTFDTDPKVRAEFLALVQMGRE
jgi:GTP cyclohydrolase I